MGTSNQSDPVIRIIPHEESFEVRVSVFFYHEENRGRPSINRRPTIEEAKASAQEFASAERARRG